MKRFSWIPVIVIFLISSCGPRTGDKYRNVFRYNEAADITSLDPAFARDQANIWAVNQLFNGLVQLDDQLNIRPCIASSWERSQDGLVYTFHLRRDVRFHDSPCFPGGKGRRVTASDFIYSFNRVRDPGTASAGAWVFNYVSENQAFNAPDDSTLVVRLKQPFPPFLGILTMQYCSVVPKEAIRHFQDDFRRNPVGTGPFRFAVWKEGVKLVLTKNPGYFESEKGERLPFLDAVSITFIPDRQSAFLEFMKGNLDFMSGIDPAYKDELLTREGELNPKYLDRVKLIRQPYLNTEYLGILMNPKGGQPAPDPLQLLNVRKAINLAFDRKKMIRFLRNGIGTPGIHGIVPPCAPGFSGDQSGYDYDPALAAKLLADAGFPGGKGLPAITLTSTPDYLDICKYIQFEVASVGIEMEIATSPPAIVKEMRARGKLPFFRASWIADYPDAESYLSLFLSGNFSPVGPNYTHFSDPGYDLLYGKAMTAPDDSTRFALYRQMESIMMEQSPVIVLYYDEVLRFVRSGVTGLGSNPMNLLSLKKVRKI